GVPGTEDEVQPEEVAAVAPFDEEGTYGGLPRKRGLAALREWVDESKHTLEEWQKRVDGGIQRAIEGITPFSTLHKDVKTRADRIAELEMKLAKAEDEERELQPGSGAPGSSSNDRDRTPQA